MIRKIVQGALAVFVLLSLLSLLNGYRTKLAGDEHVVFAAAAAARLLTVNPWTKERGYAV
ncbi:MAG TPA: hypothetical protein VJ955_02310 [Desulfuromonadales bacterium]|nr:hypothetical protein [Desulfuromonadales bacterium]